MFVGGVAFAGGLDLTDELGASSVDFQTAVEQDDLDDVKAHLKVAVPPVARQLVGAVAPLPVSLLTNSSAKKDIRVHPSLLTTLCVYRL